MTGRGRSLPAALVGTVFRPARLDDLPECGRIWRDSINAYVAPLGQPLIPDELAGIGRLHGHTLATDPERFVVATRPGPGGERIEGFGSAIVRGGPGSSGAADRPLWYLSMLFVRPDAQGEGLGRALLERLLPEPTFSGSLAVTVDSVQPISTALYARYGMIPRLPVLDLTGSIERPAAIPPLPSGVVPVAFETIADGPPDGPGHRELSEIVNGLDREILGRVHPQDHRFMRTEDRRGFLYRGPDGAALGYGYAGAVGRIGPVAVRDPDLLDVLVGHLAATVPARGATAVWAHGGAPRLIASLLAAGLRIDEFPLLLCWDRPFADLSRYLPISPGLP